MKICHITSVHPRYDVRIYLKECQTLATISDNSVSLIVADGLMDEQCTNINIYDVGKASGRLSRFVFIAHHIFKKAIQLNPDIVHFHDPELIGIGIKLAKRGFKVIYDVHEDVPKQILNKHWIPKLLRPIIAGLIKKHEQHASHKYFFGVVTATDIIANRFKTYNSNTIAIHNYPILTEYGNHNKVEWKSRQNKLCYIGSISVTRGIIELIDALEIMQLPLELAGKFSQESLQKKLEQSSGWKYVNYHGVIDRQRIEKLLSRVKIGIVTLMPTPSYVESLPIKLFEYMSAGIPVVASNFAQWEEIIKAHDCGLMVNPKSPQEITDACLWLLNNPHAAEIMGDNGRRAVLKHYSWEAEGKKLLGFYLAT